MSNPAGPLEQIRALDFLGPISSIEPIHGGITNENYLVKGSTCDVVARIGGERPLLGIDRRNELVCHRAAASHGLSPEVLHSGPTLLVSRHVAGQTLAAEDVRRTEIIARIARLLQRLHDGWDRLAGEVLYFCPFQAIRTYASSARRLEATLPEDLDELLELARRLSWRISPFRPVLCHNDLLPPNMILDGDRLWLLDWEYAGMGNPLFDLASVSANAGLPPALEEALLESYRGVIDPGELKELRTFKAASLLREALWAAIQSRISDLPFDYPGYARDNFGAFRDALGELG